MVIYFFFLTFNLEDLAPEDVIIETNNKGISESVPNSKKIMFHVSPDTSMQKDDRSNKPRYDRDFFNKHIVNVLINLKKISNFGLENWNTYYHCKKKRSNRSS